MCAGRVRRGGGKRASLDELFAPSTVDGRECNRRSTFRPALGGFGLPRPGGAADCGGARPPRSTCDFL
ncbi:hypothetical protein EVAR_31502_1 [Eumeta japonica]|uniref:Uncharacterized protein n=1 Tax=Eumeta variegata TaxID=151549 RepID=A0A4C1Z0V9_EUMVA|nr:hypothetical protein EVAR_31502_1 [Eumeta japonica]